MLLTWPGQAIAAPDLVGGVPGRAPAVLGTGTFCVYDPDPPARWTG